jgi:hypothetical protein
MSTKYKLIWPVAAACAILGASMWVLRAEPQGSGIGVPVEERRNPAQREDFRREQAEILESLLDMSPQRLARTRALIERLERMDEEEREALRKRVRAFHRQSPEEIRSQRERWRRMSPEEREEFRRELRGRLNDDPEIADEKRVNPRLEKRFEEYLRGLPREERVRVLRDLRAAARSGGDAD